MPAETNNIAPIAVRFSKATELTGICRSKLYELAAPGGPLVTVKLGKARLIRYDSLVRMIDQAA